MAVLDPHFLLLDSNIAYNQHVYGGLTDTDAQGRLLPDLQQAEADAVAALNAASAGWIDGSIGTSQLDAKDWNAAEWMKFLNDIDNKASAPRLEQIDRAYGLADTKNNEVAFRFYRAAVHAGYRAVRPNLEAFLMSVGRQKFVVPLYAALREKPEDRAWAEGIYKAARERYHPETQSSVDKAMAKQ